jgi:hypothetical protein
MGSKMDWTSISGWLAVAATTLGLVTSVATIYLALATFGVAGMAWWGVRENKKLIAATQRQADILWENAIPYVIPEEVQSLSGTGLNMRGRLKISYAAGTIPARAVTAWVGSEGRVWVGAQSLLSATGNNVKVIDLVGSRAGSEPPIEWNEWLRRQQDGITYRLVMRWVGPAEHVTERAWWVSYGYWAEVPERLRG